MKLVQINETTAINPEMVTSVCIEPKEKIIDDPDRPGHRKAIPDGKEVAVYTLGIDGEYSDYASLQYSHRFVSDYTFIETYERLTTPA